MTRACLFVIAWSLAACGGAPEGIFGDGGAGQGGAGGRTSSAEGTGAKSNATGATTQQGTTGQTSQAVTVATTGQQQSSSSGNPSQITVWCADMACEAGQVCCYYKPAFGMDHCAAPGGCPTQGDEWMEISCNGPDDCPGQECCGVYRNGWQEVECASQCGGGQIEMCEGDPLACDMGVCQPSQQLGLGYSFCGN